MGQCAVASMCMLERCLSSICISRSTTKSNLKSILAGRAQRRGSICTNTYVRIYIIYILRTRTEGVNTTHECVLRVHLHGIRINAWNIPPFGRAVNVSKIQTP